MTEPTRTETTHTHTVQNAAHPFAIALDIQGNFHRGLMLGVLVGFVLGLATVATAARLIEALR